MCRPLSGSSEWISGTRPARLFSQGSMPYCAAPLRTASIVTWKVAQGRVDSFGSALRQARSE